MENKPAFPLNVQPINALEYSGMTMRDYFAAKAMAADIASASSSNMSCEAIAMRSYAMADAMLKEREE